MSESGDFLALQHDFAASLRDPRRAPRLDIEPRRLALYRELFFNNIRATLTAAFPVLRRIYDDAAWDALLRDFYRDYRSPYPQLHRLAEAFADYLRTARAARADDPPFLGELAHYEWIELALATAIDPAPSPGLRADLDLLASAPVLSPLCRVLVYAFAVHRIGPEFQPEAPGAVPSCLAVYRDADDRVRFIELNPMSARLLQLIAENEGESGRALLQRLTAEAGHVPADELLAQGAALLADLLQRGVIAGSRPLTQCSRDSRAS